MYLSERLAVLGVQNGVAGRTEVAYRQLDVAADLDPFSDTALLATAEIARRQGDDERALTALDRAEARQPENALTYVIRARVLSSTDRREAQLQLRRVAELNPRSADLEKLGERLPGPASGSSKRD